MRTSKLKNMVRGWFVGSFEPTILDTEACEVGLKEYEAGDYEEWHYHKLATEITLIVKGNVEMAGKKYGEGDIIVIEPEEGTDFRALTAVQNVVVKIPGAKDDKYMGHPNEIDCS